jgi:uncharacterized protein YxeA
MKKKPEKKVVSRAVAIALGIVVIVLVAGLVVYAIYNYRVENQMMTQTLVNSESVSQGASAYSYWQFSVSHAGSITVLLQDFGPTRTDSAYVEVMYNSQGVNYDSGQTWLKIGQSASFPVLPTSDLEVRVGNGYLLNGAYETVTITYTY